MSDNVLKEKISSAEIISFDIFDTLLLRPFVRPKDVFGFIENVYGIKNFSKNRLKAEKQARILKLVKEKIQDCTINDIYNLLKDEYKFVKEIELDIEKQISVKNSQMVEIFNFAKEQNKKIIITSDTYLPESFVVQLLEKNNIVGYDEIFISSEIGKSKAGKDLFEFIIEKFKIEPNKILHIGDNEIADIKNPNSLGIITYYYKPLIKRFFEDDYNKRLIAFYKKYEDNPFVSLILGMRIINRKNNRNYWWNLGFNYGAPLALACVLNVIEIAKDKDLSDLFFISRDAFFLNEFYNVLKDKDSAQNHYIYLNRVIKQKYENIKKDLNNSYFKYISSIRLKGDKIGIVDTSAGTFSAQGLLQNYMDKSSFLGIYFHTRENNQFKYINLSNLHLDEVKKMFNLNFIEILLTSLEPKIEDVRNLHPVFEVHENINEVNKREFYKNILEGERDFLTQYINLFSKSVPDFNFVIIYEYISNFWNNLSADDKKYLSKIKNSVDTEQKYYISLINPQKDMMDELRKKLLNKQKNS